jgi:Mg2+ and Co2+ transporter CorA
MTNEQTERFFGTLIRLLNPYTKTMYYSANNHQVGFEAEVTRRKALEEAVNKPETEEARKLMLEEVRTALEAEKARCEAEERRREELQEAVNNPETEAARQVMLGEVRKVLEESRRALANAREVFPQFQLEVDNRHGSQNGGNYLFWEFKGQPQTVKKAVRIQFRHPDAEGVWITDHLLVGYAGSNGP